MNWLEGLGDNSIHGITGVSRVFLSARGDDSTSDEVPGCGSSTMQLNENVLSNPVVAELHKRSATPYKHEKRSY